MVAPPTQEVGYIIWCGGMVLLGACGIVAVGFWWSVNIEWASGAIVGWPLPSDLASGILNTLYLPRPCSGAANKIIIINLPLPPSLSEIRSEKNANFG